MGDRGYETRRGSLLAPPGPLAPPARRAGQPLGHQHRRHRKRRQWRLAHAHHGAHQPFKSSDPDSARIFWSDGGVHQNITFPVHPDPISGMHCWHQKVRIERARPEDIPTATSLWIRTNPSRCTRKWLKMTRPAPGPNGLRRPLWMKRALRPAEETFYRRGI
jgi:hypothetical protein